MVAAWVMLTSSQFLEHMIGSQSLVATVGHAITLHSLDVLTVALLAFWALSPLGGQSVLRLLHETNSTVTENRPVFYSDVSAGSQFVGGSSYEDVYNRANAVVSTALMTAESLEWTPEDAWSHPKIPRIGELEAAESKNSTERPWYTVDPKGNYSYASLAGINTVNLSRQGSTNLTVPYEYMYFSCELSPSNNFTRPVNPYTGELDQPQSNSLTILNYLVGLQNQSKLTTQGWDAPLNSSISLIPQDNSFFMYTKGTWDNMEGILYGSRGVSTLAVYLWECSMNSVMVEANIICQSDSCKVERLRRKKVSEKESANDGTPYGITHVWQWNRYFINALASLGGAVSTYRSNPVDSYIYGMTNPWSVLPGAMTTPPTQNWTTYIDAPEKAVEMSQRMTKVLNTYLDSSRWPMAVTQSDPFAERSLEGGQPSLSLTMNSTEAVVSTLVPVYRVNAPWAALLVTCSAVLLLLSIFGLFTQTRTVAPDIFNHVSSLTRDNPHVNAPAGGSALDGADRARLLQKMRVQVGDTDSQADTGYVAFRSIESSEDGRVGKIRGERLYR